MMMMRKETNEKEEKEKERQKREEEDENKDHDRAQEENKKSILLGTHVGLPLRSAVCLHPSLFLFPSLRLQC